MRRTEPEFLKTDESLVAISARIKALANLVGTQQRELFSEMAEASFGYVRAECYALSNLLEGIGDSLAPLDSQPRSGQVLPLEDRDAGESAIS